jgi:predicted lipoprotein with Yx(FWY)xxD motif
VRVGMSSDHAPDGSGARVRAQGERKVGGNVGGDGTDTGGDPTPGGRAVRTPGRTLRQVGFGLRRPRCLAVAAIVLLGAAAGCGGSASSNTTTSNPGGGGTARIDAAYLADAKQTVLVNGSGYALYMFVPDHQRSVTCSITCVASWPPLTVSPGARPQVGPKVKRSLVGTVAFTPGYRVATYNRWPLYTYEDDVKPGQVTGQGIDLNGGYWYLMSPDGDPIVPAGDPAP